MSIKSDVQKMNLGTLLEFFVLDTTVIGGSLVLHFHSGVAYSSSLTWNDVVWSNPIETGGPVVPITYSRWPVQASGFEWNGRGTLPRPKLQASNTFGYLSGLNYANADLVGCKVVRKRTLLKYLDAVNFPGGVNATADPNVAFGNEVYLIDRKAEENPVYCEYELASAFDVHGAKLPGRQVVQNVCPWRYRGTECGFSGGAIATATDLATSDLLLDACGKKLTSCKLRFGTSAILPYGGFPSVGLV